MNSFCIPVTLRLVVYSFFDFEVLLSKACKVSKRDRDAMVRSQILDNGTTTLTVWFEPDSDRKLWPPIAIDLATRIRLIMHKFEQDDVQKMQKIVLKNNFSTSDEILAYNYVEIDNPKFDLDLFTEIAGSIDLRSVYFHFVNEDEVDPSIEKLNKFLSAISATHIFIHDKI